MIQYRRRQAAMIGCLVAVLLAGGVIATPLAAAETPEADSVVFDVTLQDDGDAIWRVAYRYQLTDEEEKQVFDSLSGEIAEDPTQYTDRFAADISTAVRTAANETDREMQLRNVSVTTSEQAIPQATGTYGKVIYRFEWTNFAVVTESGLRAGDAISGFYISPNTELLLSWPTTYEPTETLRPKPDEVTETRVVWEGETTFGSDEPRVALDKTGTTSEASGAGVPVGLLLAGVVGLGLVGTAGVIALRRTREDGSATPGEEGAELLSNEEQVVAALREHDGRMKQQELAAACDWNDSKTSKVVTELKEEGAIDVFRLGRENVISLPEETNE